MQQRHQAFLFSENIIGKVRALPIDQNTLDTMLANGEVELVPGSRIAYRMKPVVLEDHDESKASTYETKVMVANTGRSARTVRK